MRLLKLIKFQVITFAFRPLLMEKVYGLLRQLDQDQLLPSPIRERTLLSWAEAIRLMRLNARDSPMTASYVDNLVRRMKGKKGLLRVKYGKLT